MNPDESPRHPAAAAGCRRLAALSLAALCCVLVEPAIPGARAAAGTPAVSATPAVPGTPAAQEVARGRSAPPMATREVTVFLRKERALHEAMASGRLEDIDALLSRDFVARPGGHPGQPVTRAAWLQGSAPRQFPGRVEQLSVRLLDAAALVSFVWVLPGATGRVAVVDLWDGTDENAHLLERHATPLGNAVLEEGRPEPGPSRR